MKNKKTVGYSFFFTFSLVLILISTQSVEIISSSMTLKPEMKNVYSCSDNDQFQTSTNTVIDTMAATLPDLQLIRFEGWWAKVNNGTLFIRYSVKNTGATYHNPANPVYLLIFFTLNGSEEIFTFIHQKSFFDPYTWHHNQTLSGCIHVPCNVKPDSISAHINPYKTIPESNYSNNIHCSPVLDGVVISGTVFRNRNGLSIPANNISITRCNSSSLEPSLSILFSTNSTGEFTVVLSPYHPIDQRFRYDLLFTDKQTNQKIHMRTEPITSEDKHQLPPVTFQDQLIQRPNRGIAFRLWKRNIPMLLLYIIEDHEDVRFYKVQWDSFSFSDWIGPSSANKLFLLSHTFRTSGLKPIRLISKDRNGLLSEWSEPTYVFII